MKGGGETKKKEKLGSKASRKRKKYQAQTGGRKQRLKFLLELYDELKIGDKRLNDKNWGAEKAFVGEAHREKYPLGFGGVGLNGGRQPYIQI